MSDQHFNKLTAGQTERLALLAEEAGEVVQIVGKILRHGLNSCHPKNASQDNADLLAIEIGDFQHAVELLAQAGDVSVQAIQEARNDKAESVARYLHHQGTIR
jgi:NTP pyrophosphatase (non-canonical NTP hydrolase)